MNNKVVWITGASSGIGAACAQACSQAGAKVILSARRSKALATVQESLSGPSEILIMDVADGDSLESKVDQAWKLYGHIDILINNAGISQRSLVMDTDLAIDRKIFEVNYFGNIAITKLLLPRMQEHGSGNIVVISSLAGKMSTPGRSAYAASKHALQGYYDALRSEVADMGIIIQVICPGYINTDISRNALKGDGSTHDILDPNQAKGISAQACADAIVRGIKNNRAEVIIAGSEKRYVWIKNLLPGMYRNALAKMAKEGSY